MIRINLPVPPSTNALYANNKRAGRGRYKTAAYRDWLRQADSHLLPQYRNLEGIPCSVDVLKISIPRSMRGDASNRIKALEDFLVSREITTDDRHHRKVSIERADVTCCVVEITPMVQK